MIIIQIYKLTQLPLIVFYFCFKHYKNISSEICTAEAIVI